MRGRVDVKLMADARRRIREETGRCEGRKPFGTFEGEPEVVEKMRELRSAGLGFDRIADWLNDRGCWTRKGTEWWGKTINVILSRGQEKAHG